MHPYGSEVSLDSIPQNLLGDHMTPDPPPCSYHRSLSPEYWSVTPVTSHQLQYKAWAFKTVQCEVLLLSRATELLFPILCFPGFDYSSVFWLTCFCLSPFELFLPVVMFVFLLYLLPFLDLICACFLTTILIDESNSEALFYFIFFFFLSASVWVVLSCYTDQVNSHMVFLPNQEKLWLGLNRCTDRAFTLSSADCCWYNSLYNA